MGRPLKPKDLLVTNGWYLEMAGLVSPHFQTLEGLSKKTGMTSIVDAGTNINYGFSDQIKDFGEITLNRTLDLSQDDTAFKLLVDASIDGGINHIAQLVKMHFNKEVFRVTLNGILFLEYNYPSMNVNSGEQFSVSCRAKVQEIIGMR
jgi:hypothetical protein